MVTIKYDDLSTAFDFVSSAAPTEHRACVSLDTGTIYWISELNPFEEEELPPDLETSDRYVEIPHRNDLDLGRRLAVRFVEARLPHRCDTAMFRRRGAYAHFKDPLTAKGCLEEWYALEPKATDRALREWCRLNEISLVHGVREPSV